MNLSELLDEETLEKVNEAIEKSNDVDELIPNDGSYVPRERLNDKNDKIEALEEQIEQRNEQLEQLKEDTNATDELKSKIEELKEKNEKTEKELQEKLEQERKERVIEVALAESGAKNKDAVKSLLDMDQVEVVDDETRGLEKQIETLKEEEDYLFESESTPSKGGQDFNGGSDEGGLTMEQIDAMDEDEINANWDEVQKVLQQQE